VKRRIAKLEGAFGPELQRLEEWRSRAAERFRLQLLVPLMRAANELATTGNSINRVDLGVADSAEKIGGDGPYAGVFVASAYWAALWSDGSTADFFLRLKKLQEIQNRMRPVARARRKRKRGESWTAW